MVGRHVNAATGAAYAPERLKPGGDHLLSRQRRRAVSTPERRRQEARERQALQGMGQSESAAFSERLDFRAAKQGQARLSTPFHKYGHVCDEGFLAQTRRERRAYPSGVCKECATTSGPKRTVARRQRDGATAAGAGGAGKTVDAGLDRAPLPIFRRDLPQIF